MAMKLEMKLKTQACCLLLLTCTLAGCASTSNKILYAPITSQWLVIPGEVTLGERVVNKEEIIFHQRVLPSRLAVLKSAIKTQGDLPIDLGEGSELYQAQIYASSQATMAFCSAKGVYIKSSVSRFFSNKISGLSYRPCFIDADNDLKFERAVLGNMKSAVQPGHVIQDVEVADPITYEFVPRSEFKENYFVGVIVYDIFNIYNKYWLRAVCCELNSFDPIGFEVTAPRGDFPQKFDIMGARITVLGKSDDKFRISVDSPIPASVFSVTATTLSESQRMEKSRRIEQN